MLGIGLGLNIGNLWGGNPFKLLPGGLIREITHPPLLPDLVQLREGIAIANDGTEFAIDVPFVTADGVTSEPAATNSCADSRDFEGVGWSGDATAVQDQVGFDGVANKAWTLTDNSVTVSEYKEYSAVVPNDNESHTNSCPVLKDLNESRFPAVMFYLVGGTTPVYSLIQVNTKTGELVEVESVGGGVGSFESRLVGDFWVIVSTIVNNTTGNIQLKSRLYGALGTVWGVVDATAIGSAVFDQLDIRLNQSFMDSPIITSGTALTRAATTETSVLMDVDGVSTGLFEALNGAVSGTTLESGNLIVDEFYQVIATTADFFGAGVVAGNRFTAASALALSAENSVQLVSPIRTAISCDWTPGAGVGGISGGVSVLSAIPDTLGIIYIDATNGRLKTYDTVLDPQVDFTFITNITYSLRVIAGIASDMLNPTGTGPATGLIGGDKYFQIGYSDDAGATWVFSAPSAFVGRFAVDAKLHLPYGTPAIPTEVNNFWVSTYEGL